MNCQRCAKAFEPRYSWQRYCDPDCAYDVVYQRSLDRYYKDRVLQTETRHCKVCSAPFQWRGRAHKTKTCSRQCRAQNIRNNHCAHVKRKKEKEMIQ